MKNINILVGLVLLFHCAQAQRFFYIEHNHITDKLLADRLAQASQYIVKSPMGSDYIIKSDVELIPESNTFNLKIQLQDSITFQTIFQANEAYTLKTSQTDNKLFLSMAIRTFIEKNMNRMILCAKDDHFNTEAKWLAPRKDKT